MKPSQVVCRLASLSRVLISIVSLRSLLMACFGKMAARHLEVHETARAFLLRSDDGGRDWEYLSTIGYDAAGIVSFWEPSICRTPNGVLVCMMRAVCEPRWRHDNLWVSYSRDDGYSWSRPERTPLWGYPPHLTVLEDLRLMYMRIQQIDGNWQLVGWSLLRRDPAPRHDEGRAKPVVAYHGTDKPHIRGEEGAVQ